MRLRLKTIRQRQKLQEKRASELEGHPYVEAAEATHGQIDVEELLEEEHPLTSWVETREGLDEPLFDPDDVEWAEGMLDGVEARDPELRTSKRPRHAGTSSQPHVQPPPEADIEPARHSDSLPPTPRMATIPMRRSASQIERLDKTARDDPAISKMKEIYTRTGNTPRGKGVHERVKEKLKEISTRRKLKMIVQSDDESHDSHPPSDDDGTAAAVNAPAGYGQHDSEPSFTPYVGTHGHGGESGGGDGGGRHESGDGGQQASMFDWGYGYYQPQLAPLSFDDSTSSTHGVPSDSGASSTQQGFTPRGIQREFHDMAASLFGYGYGQYMQSSYGQGERHDDEEESSSSQYPYMY